MTKKRRREKKKRQDNAVRVSLSVESVSPGCSWEEAFGAASRVEPEPLSEEFLDRTTSNVVDDHLAKIKTLAKKRRTNENVNENENEKVDENENGKVDENENGNVDGNENEEVDDNENDKVDDGENVDFPFRTDPDDHCETPMEAYRHVLPLLEKLFPNKAVTIYDPYYCNGAAKRHLTQLGFCVYHEKEDCYDAWTRGLPPRDVLVTNPPYSSNHLPRLLQYVASRDEPFFLLLPTWVHKKDYYVQAMMKQKPFYLVPKKRYIYLPPKHFREKKASDVHKKSSPFVTMWYVWGGSDAKNNMLIDHYRKTVRDAPCHIARTRSALRDLRRKN